MGDEDSKDDSEDSEDSNDDSSDDDDEDKDDKEDEDEDDSSAKKPKPPFKAKLRGAASPTPGKKVPADATMKGSAKVPPILQRLIDQGKNKKSPSSPEDRGESSHESPILKKMKKMQEKKTQSDKSGV